MKRKSVVAAILMAGLMTSTMMSGCGRATVVAANEAETQSASQQNQNSPQEKDADSEEAITIVYTNDVHSYVANEKEKEKDAPADQPAEDGMRFSKVAQMVKDMRAEDKNVLLVDAGDHLQGNIYGSVDEGETVIDLMNATGYQLATLGNHEFDYGTSTLFQRVDQADFPYISCSFHSVDKEKAGDPFESTQIFQFNDTSVAFVGITTPQTFFASTPVYFQDEAGNFIYEVDGVKTPEDLYDSVQNAIDSVRDQVDYVIALGHTGVGECVSDYKIASTDIISHTTGIDAYIDGHSHTFMDGEKVKNLEGEDVLLTQAGNYFQAVGVMEISPEGEFSSHLVSDYEAEDEKVAAMEDAMIQDIDEKMGQEIGTLDMKLTVKDPENEERWLVRSVEVNVGDFIADSMYWYFNEAQNLDCDVAIINGSGIRQSMEKGGVTMRDIKSTIPFGNVICMINATGQQILDALEKGASHVGRKSEDGFQPAHNVAFLHVAGLRYTVDSSIESNVKTDENGVFQSVDGAYKVSNVQVYNKKTGCYEPLELDKTYKVGGLNYLLRNCGVGLSMFEHCEEVVDFVGMDSDILADYISSFEKNGDLPEVTSANSPLAQYAGYDLNYENPLGSGRVVME
ncbi:MAG: bifunctional UDP-sugar hydrolase/5'-nucleotidase [Lachnospiraceae bacterium]|nr:bifunctional UDP-sugar hydrolase/5'-nucleotidase [Lachnospiraceae bacterium]